MLTIRYAISLVLDSNFLYITTALFILIAKSQNKMIAVWMLFKEKNINVTILMRVDDKVPKECLVQVKNKSSIGRFIFTKIYNQKI